MNHDWLEVDGEEDMAMGPAEHEPWIERGQPARHLELAHVVVLSR